MKISTNNSVTIIMLCMAFFIFNICISVHYFNKNANLTKWINIVDAIENVRIHSTVFNVQKKYYTIHRNMVSEYKLESDIDLISDNTNVLIEIIEN